MRFPGMVMGWVLLAGALAGGGPAGCHTTVTEEPVGTGTLSDINRKLGGSSKPAARPRSESSRPQMVLLVVHDAEGRPVYVETQRSSGDAALDQRAQEWVLKERRFSKGRPNTVVLTLDPRDVPSR